MPITISEIVLDRLPLYARGLALLGSEGREVVRSEDLAMLLGVSPAQVRKDLSYFGRFGKQGRGYDVGLLLDQLQQILGLDQEWTMTLVGAGRLGHAILDYPGFVPQGFRFLSAFDVAPDRIGELVAGLKIRDVANLEDVLRSQPVDIGVVAVPAAAAQAVTDRLVACAIGAILNYAPIALNVPPYVLVRQIDPVLVLQAMTYYLSENRTTGGR